ncbi:MAG: AAA family ATPase [Coriobacteriia bacterium]|nr:AAA family ATPase [Coriobacteriia bacterium]
MKINKISCESFAGLSDKEIRLEDGLNIIEGPNESGKTTMVDLAYSALFQDAKVGARAASDKEFRNLYYPRMASGFQGEPDGAVSFDGAAGTFVLRKEWGADGSVSLKTPDGIRVKDADAIKQILQEELGYGQATYKELVFSSQRRPITAVAEILNGAAKDGSLADLTDQVMQSVMETGGMSLDAFEKGLDEKIAALGGNWDFDADLPNGGRKRGINNPWKRSVGAILQAYYDAEQVRSELDEVAQREANCQNAQDARAHAERGFAQAQQARQEFELARGLEKERRNAQAAVDNARTACSLAARAQAEAQSVADQCEKAQVQWPQLQKLHDAVDVLLNQQVQAQRAEQVAKALADAQQAKAAFDQANAAVPESAPTAQDADRVAALERQESKLHAQLSGLNIAATLSAVNPEAVRVIGLSSGEPVDISSGEFAIKEAVRICVPGVMELTLSPRGVDVERVQAQVQQASQERASILATFGAQDAAALQALSTAAANAAMKRDAAKSSLERVLNGATMEDLERACAENPVGEKSAQDIATELDGLCKGKDPRTILGKAQSSLESLVQAYGSLEGLAQKLAAAKEDVTQKAAAVEGAQKNLELCQQKLQELPTPAVDLSAVADLDAHAAQLEQREKTALEQRTEATAGVAEAEALLSQMPKTAEELTADLKDAEAALASLKKEHARWAHIKQVYEQVKAQNVNNPMTDVRDRFCKYLFEATGGALQLNDLTDSMSASITSGTSQLNWDIASEGTRDAISLAFRLALLDHLFPQGGCFVVLDDPFTDMDPERTQQACSMIARFAERNQVIFATCDPKYRQLLPDANVIEWTK